MKAFTINDLRALSKEDILSLRGMAKSGDNMARWKMAMCVLYKQIDSGKNESFSSYLAPSSTDQEENLLLLAGYAYEHAIDTPKNYAKAIECYSKAYGLLHAVKPSSKVKVADVSKALKEMEKQYDVLIKQITKVFAVKKFCLFKDGQFLFPWSDETRDALGKMLPQLSNDIADFGELFAKAVTNLKDEKQTLWEYRYQDTLLMPIEVIKALVARDHFERHLKGNGFEVLPSDPYFNNALGRCLIDDDDAYDNDYIIGGLLNVAGHEGNTLWQYRTGLWYEYCDDNLEPMAAEYWYEQAKKELPAAKTALERLQNSLNYRILVNAKEGTAKDCQTLMKRSSKNPQNSIGWMIESALRGDESAIQRLESNQFSPKGQSSILGTLSSADDNQHYYTLLKKEIFADQKALHQWESTVVAEKEAYRKRIEEEARRKAEAERRRLEAERKAKEEAIRKAREAEEAKRRAEEAKLRAEEEAKHKAEEAERKRLEAERKAKEEAIRKAKEAEDARQRAEEEASRKAEEAERKRLEAERKAKQDAIRKAKEAEEAKRRADALMLKLQEEKKEKNRKIILFVSCIILSIIPWVWISFGGWEAMGWYSILLGAIIASFVGVGTLGIVVGDEKQWKAILFRSVFALIALGLMIKSIISGTFGLSSICVSIFAGLFCTGLVMVFSKPSFFE